MDEQVPTLACAYSLIGRGDTALTLATSAEELILRRPTLHGPIIPPLADAYLLRGRTDDALRSGCNGLDRARSTGQRENEARILRILGEIAARGEPPDLTSAERHYREALMLAEPRGMRPLQAHCHLGLGKLYRRTGRLDVARAELATAVAMLREMGMAFWLPEAEAELAEAERA
jgi:hypothetical protein